MSIRAFALAALAAGISTPVFAFDPADRPSDVQIERRSYLISGSAVGTSGAVQFTPGYDPASRPEDRQIGALLKSAEPGFANRQLSDYRPSWRPESSYRQVGN